MTPVAVTKSYLIRLARDPKYNWMSSLRAIRETYVIAGLQQPTKKCCGQRKPAVAVPDTAIARVTSDPRFLSDLRALKVREQFGPVVINVGSLQARL
jgi:hypothetical protein